MTNLTAVQFVSWPELRTNHRLNGGFSAPFRPEYCKCTSAQVLNSYCIRSERIVGGSALSPSKTVAGTVGGIASATLQAAAFYPITPFSPFQAALIGLIICIMGFLGGLVMSAIKRDRGVKDWGNLIHGHGGMLDRVDSVCFAAPVFFHVVRYFWNG